MWAVEALKQWHDFYALVGTAGATLLWPAVCCRFAHGAGYLTEEYHPASPHVLSAR